MDEIDPSVTTAPALERNLGRKVYVRHGPQTWEAARRLYASGMTAGDVARTLDLSISAIRVAAARGGWTRRHLAGGAAAVAAGAALPTSAPLPSPDEGGREDGPTWFRLSADAWLMIRGEYLGGATAKALAKKWGVSATSIYRHACQEGWTKESRGAAVGAVLIAQMKAQTVAEQEQASEHRAQVAADPLATAEGLLRLGAGEAAGGQAGPARRSVGLAQNLLRVLRQLDAAKGRSGAAAAAQDEERESEEKARAAEHPDSPEPVAARAVILRGAARLRLARGRRPPQELSGFFYLEDRPGCRPLAEALELVDERGRVECRDFEAAVEAARARGRGELIDRALAELIPWEHCTWLTDDQKAEVARREAAAAVPAPVIHEAEVASWAALGEACDASASPGLSRPIGVYRL